MPKVGQFSTPIDRLACEEAANDLQGALEAHQKNIERAEDLKTQIKTLETQLEGLPETDLTDLRDALSVAAGATEANLTLSVSESEVRRLTREVKDRYQQLGGVPGDFDATVSLPVPGKATIRRFSEQMDGINRDIESEESKIIEGKKLVESIHLELRRLERRGELPTDQALRNARDHRDHGWDLVLAEWKGEGSCEEFVPGKPLEEAFPEAISHADDIADQFRDQAEAVAQAEEKRSQIAQHEKLHQDAEREILGLRHKSSECQTSWEDAWANCGVTPLTPAEMEEWREIWNEFKNLLRQLRDSEEIFQQKSNQVREAKILLAKALSEPDEQKEFSLLFDEARRQVQHEEQLSGRRIEVINQLTGLKNQLEAFEQKNKRFITAVDVATKKWEGQCQAVRMPESISPKAGLTLLQERKEVLAKFDSWKGISSRLHGIKNAVREYEQAVNKKAVALGVQKDITEGQEAELWKMLAEARDNQTRHEQIARQIEEAKNSLEETQTFYSQAVQDLEEIIRVAKLETHDALEPLLANLELRDRALTQIAAFRDILTAPARGLSVDDFVSRIKAEDIEGLSQRKGGLRIQKHEKEASLQTARDTLSGLKDQRQILEASGDSAANYRQQAESRAALLKKEASYFIRLRLAVHFLQSQIERFRKENQGPLLEKSGRVFSSITRGAFSGLGAEFNADDAPILVGLRTDLSSVPIERMSDGTRDQLYLALRLAALDRHLEQHEPMPLILDDLLITCDNERATAILPQLAELAQRTQIFLFTHHAHLVELCHQTLGGESFHLHQLNSIYEL